MLQREKRFSLSSRISRAKFAKTKKERSNNSGNRIQVASMFVYAELELVNLSVSIS